MPAIYRAEPVCDEKVENDSRPEAFGHAERRRLDDREPLEPKQRVWRENERPDLLKISACEPESFDHWDNICGPIHCGHFGCCVSFQGQPPWTLPERSLGLDVREQGGSDQCEDCIDVRLRGLWQLPRAYPEFFYDKSRNGGLADRPYYRVTLVERAKALSGVCKAFRHPQRQTQIDSQREPHTRGKQRPSKRIEHCGVDQASVWRKSVERDCKIGLRFKYGIGKLAQRRWTQRV